MKIHNLFSFTIFRWEFRTEDFDIGFGVSRKVKKGEEEVLLPMQRVNSQLVTEEGYLVCTEPGTCEYYLVLLVLTTDRVAIYF